MQKFIELGGEKIPSLGFGTFRLGGQDCLDGVTDALEIGYRHIDTAQAYDNEEFVGEAIANSTIDRNEIFLTTKITQENLSKDKFLPSLEKSLKKLKVDFVDLLLIHWPSDDKSNYSAIQELKIAQDKGYAKLIGVSNFTLRQLKAAKEQANIFCNQVEYHPYLCQDKILDLLRENNMMLTSYSPLGVGRILKDDTIISLAGKYDHTPAQVVLRWHIQQENVSAIPKASNKEHRKSNFGIFDFELNDEDMKKIFSLDRNERFVNPSWSPEWDK
ncbi:aldo/keto reductase [soil metagenome]